VRQLLSSEQFSVDGTLIEGWANLKSFVPRDGDGPPAGKSGGEGRGRNAERGFHGEKRKNDTHSSTTDPDARLTEANGRAEREAALDMIKDDVRLGGTVGGDKNYDIADFVAGCRKRGCTTHVVQNGL
jgi:hypothetical protein